LGILQVTNGGFSSLALASPAYALGTYIQGINFGRSLHRLQFIWLTPILETNSNPTLRAQQNPGY
jgi:hypothetical protein